MRVSQLAQISIALAMPLIYVGYKVMPGCSKYATGVPGTMDHLLWRYGLLNFVLGALQTWCSANNSTIYAEVRGAGSVCAVCCMQQASNRAMESALWFCLMRCGQSILLAMAPVAVSGQLDRSGLFGWVWPSGMPLRLLCRSLRRGAAAHCLCAASLCGSCQ